MVLLLIDRHPLTGKNVNVCEIQESGAFLLVQRSIDSMSFGATFQSAVHLGGANTYVLCCKCLAFIFFLPQIAS